MRTSANGFTGTQPPSSHEALANHASNYGYDGRGRRTLVRDPDLGEHRFVWDATGNLIERQRPDQSRLRYNFDLAGRLVSEGWGADSSLEVVQEWDIHAENPTALRFRGKLTKVRDPSGGTAFEYDERGRIIATHLDIGGQRFTTKSQFDNLDREALHVYPDGSSIQIHRNSRGQLSGYGDALKLQYDGDGLELERRFSTGALQTFEYDADRRLEFQKVSDVGGEVVEHLKWTYDGGGNVRGIADLRPDVSPELDRSESYTYDNLYRLTMADGRWGKMEWAYSPSGNLLRRKSSAALANVGSISYGHNAGPHAPTNVNGNPLAYDALGRLLSDGDRTYDWNVADQLVSVTSKSGAKAESTFDSKGVRRVRTETDPSGAKSTVLFISPWSEVRDGKLQRYIVHAGRRVARLAPETGNVAAVVTPTPSGSMGESARHHLFSLLASGQLILTSVVLAIVAWFYRRRFAFTTRLALVASLLSLTACGGDSPTPNTPLPPGGSVRTLSSSDRLIFSDQLGSVLAETSGTGQVQGRFATYPYGVARYDTSSESQRFATGVRDSGVGLDLFGARFYNASLGFWSSGDAVALDSPEALVGADFGAANPYAYANLTPVVAADNNGDFWHIVAGAAIGAVVGAGIEGARQYATTGRIDDWGRVGAASAGGALGGAITAAVPAAGLVAVLGIGGASTTATGLAERAIVSGGKDLGTARDIAIDAGVGMLTAGVVRGGSKVVQSLRAVKPAGVSASAPTASQSPRGGAAERAIVPFYPANSGFLGETTQTILTEGRVIDRVGGSANSRFFSPVGTPLAARALPPGTVGPLHSFEVVKPFSVEAGTVAPAFGQLGMGTQFRSAKTLGELTQQGFLRAVP